MLPSTHQTSLCPDAFAPTWLFYYVRGFFITTKCAVTSTRLIYFIAFSKKGVMSCVLAFTFLSGRAAGVIFVIS